MSELPCSSLQTYTYYIQCFLFRRIRALRNEIEKVRKVREEKDKEIQERRMLYNAQMQQSAAQLQEDIKVHTASVWNYLG